MCMDSVVIEVKTGMGRRGVRISAEATEQKSDVMVCYTLVETITVCE